MIDLNTVRQTVEKAIEGTLIYIVDLRLEPGNRIVVELDSHDPIDLNTIAALHRRIEDDLDRDKEDFELEVGTSALTAPFKVRQQYLKNIGREVEVLTTTGSKLRGVLSAVNPGDFVIEVPSKVKAPGEKRPKTVGVPTTIPFSEAKSVKIVFKF